MILAERPRLQAAPKGEPEPRRAGTWPLAMLAMSLIAGGGYLAQLVTDPAALPIRKVKVEGDFRNLAPSHVQTLVAGAVRGGFFSVDVQAVRARILEEPWVFDATVRRAWPDGIRVAIVEQQPTARWGENALLNRGADVFAPAPDSFPPGLPRLAGPVGSEADVLAAFHTARQRLQMLGLEVTGMSLSDRRAWSIDLADGARLIVGRQELAPRLARFCAAYTAVLQPQWRRVAAIDLRYPNGFAVRDREIDPAADDGRADAASDDRQ